MTNVTSAAFSTFVKDHSFASFTLLSLIAIAVLVIAVIEQEVMRALRPADRGRNSRILGIAIYPFSILAVSVVVNRFIHLA